MIDLRKPALPDCLIVAGGRYPIYTGFRTWISFEHDITERGLCMPYIFVEDVPDDASWVDAAIGFLSSPNDTPRSIRQPTERAVDYVADGDYIVAAFQQAYGIDLTDPSLSLHWHRFLALFRGLPDSTLMAQAMGYRTWRHDKRDGDVVARELKEAWKLDGGPTERQKADVLKLFNERYS